MNIDREFPDSHVTCLADQFCATAELLLKSIPAVTAPHAMRCNAVFAIELYLKSLKCQWVHHNQLDETGIDFDIITTKLDIRGHEIDLLFDKLDLNTQKFLMGCFDSHQLNKKYPTLRQILKEYSNNFVTDRYVFEQLEDDFNHPISETVNLAIFFRDTINAMPIVRTSNMEN